MANKDLDVATIGVITALPKEYAAVREVLGCGPEIAVAGTGAGRKYSVARLEGTGGFEHVVAVALIANVGNNSAANRANRMREHCPSLQHFIMVGIAGAIPNPQKAEDHVRLGDVIVSDRGGVVKYDFIKREPRTTEDRHPPRPPGAALLEAVNSLKTQEELGESPWGSYIAAFAKKRPAWKRPPAKLDTLKDDVKAGDPVEHPKDAARRPRKPRIFHGIVASADTLLKDPTVRDALRDKYKAKCVEMEASGIADAAWELAMGYLVVRGACDYCNPAKGDKWQKYAALVAAAYARCVIEEMAPIASVTTVPLLEPSKPADQKIRRKRDVGVLKELFSWIHMGILNHFIDRLGYQRLTLNGLGALQGFARIFEKPDFHLNDKALEANVRSLYEMWLALHRATEEMDLSSNQRELFFRLPGDVFMDVDQHEAFNQLRAAAPKFVAALRTLFAYVKDNFLEIDFTTIGENAPDAEWDG